MFPSPARAGPAPPSSARPFHDRSSVCSVVLVLSDCAICIAQDVNATRMKLYPRIRAGMPPCNACVVHACTDRYGLQPHSKAPSALPDQEQSACTLASEEQAGEGGRAGGREGGREGGRARREAGSGGSGAEGGRKE
jgi:hypothetical protein